MAGRSTPAAAGRAPVRGSARVPGAIQPGGTRYGTPVSGPPTGIGPRTRAVAAVQVPTRHPAEPGTPGGPAGPGGPGGPGGRGRGPAGPGGPGAAAKKARRRKRLKIAALVLVGIVAVGIAGGGVGYAAVDLPPIPTSSQTSFVYFADGKSEIARFATENRQEVTLDEVPADVRNAVLAAEDSNFNENSGVSISGTGRAVWGLVRGEDKGGGSTITQQYVRNVLDLTQERSFKRKAKEIVLAQKMAQSKSKDDILAGYLNTIYFGRGAWGIQAASQAYFGKKVDQLTVDQGAVLAAVIKDPTNFDPANNAPSAQGRWGYVLDRMVASGWLDGGKRAALKYPKVSAPVANKAAWRQGANGVLAGRVEQELTDLGIDQQKLNTGGLRVYTTVDRRAQKAAEKVTVDALKGQDPRMATALAAVEPGTGKVRAYYGGNRGYGNLDLGKSPHPAGSSFKPYVLARAIEDGYGIRSKWDGTSGQKFPDRATLLRNAGNDSSCGTRCSLVDATRKSLNTVYWAVTRKVGPRNVATLAYQSGIRNLDGKNTLEVAKDPELNSGIGIGQYSISVLDQADGYATFANYGVRVAPYFVEKVLAPDGSVVFDRANSKPATNRAFSEDTARDATYAMEQVYKAGTRSKRLDDNRIAAGKTGTQQYRNTADNAHAWMCGYTPQLATAVWIGSGGKEDITLRDKVNGGIVYGSGLPRTIWRDFMSAALAGKDEVDFKEPVYAGDKEGNAKAPPPPPPSPTANPDPEDPGTDPSPDPSGSPDPEPTLSLPPDPTGTVQPTLPPRKPRSPKVTLPPGA